MAIGSARATATFLPLLWFRSASQACSDASLLTQLFTGTIQDIGQLDGRKNERHASPPDRNTHGLSCARGFLVCATARLYVIGPLTLQCIFCGVSRPCTLHLRYTRIHLGYRILRDTVAGCIKIHQDTPSRRNSTTSFTRKPHRSRNALPHQCVYSDYTPFVEMIIEQMLPRGASAWLCSPIFGRELQCERALG